MIVMAYYPDGNILDAGIVDDERYVSALGQILEGLSHLHAKGVVHRDLKSENFLVEKKPLFKVVITDFGLSKVVTNTTLLTTFCGTLKYIAPEVFPGDSKGHGPLADVWSLGVIVLEWIYNIPTPPDVPKPKGKGKNVPPEEWYQWVQSWSDQLFHKLDNEEAGQVVELLLRMIVVKATRRWGAWKCLTQGFANGLFKRRTADGLVVCSRDPDELAEPVDGGADGTKTPSAALPSAGSDPEANIILGNMWGAAEVRRTCLEPALTALPTLARN